MDGKTVLRWVLAATFALVGLWRALQTAALIGIPDVSLGASFVLAGQGVTALAAAIFLVFESRARGRLALLLFAVFVVVGMGMDALVYGFRSLWEALAGILLGLTLAALGWIALDSFYKEPPTRAHFGAGSDPGTP
jgi:hypothetical protein